MVYMALGWESVVTVIGAFGAASTAQFFSHKLTLKRENEKYDKERYQNLYSPLIFKVMNYIVAEGELMKEKTSPPVKKDVKETDKPKSYVIAKIELPEPDIIFEEIMSILEKNLKYASSTFIQVYEEFNSYQMIPKDPNIPEDFKANIVSGRKDMALERRMKMCEEFLDDYLNSSEELGMLSKDIGHHVINLRNGLKIFNLARKYRFRKTSYALLEFTAVGYRKMLSIPDIVELTNNTEVKVDSSLKNYNFNQNTEDEINLSSFDEFGILIGNIINHLRDKHSGVKFMRTLENGLNEDLKRIEKVIEINKKREKGTLRLVP